MAILQNSQTSQSVSVDVRLPSLDGWRALSIIMVLGAHCNITQNFPKTLSPLFRFAFDGDLGVRFFFIISGFLITWLMLKEKQTTDTINLKYFYIRRSLRILPVYMAFLSVLLALQIYTPFHQQAIHWVGNLTFTTNFTGASWSSGHLWSLAVEEQFYLLWPSAFYATMKFNRPRIAHLILAFPIFFAPLCRVVVCKNWQPESLNWLFSHYSFICNFDSLAYGCIAALLLNHKASALHRIFQNHNARLILLSMALLIAPYVLVQFHAPARLLALSGPSLQAIGFSICLLNSVLFPTHTFNQILNWKLVSHFGVLSYSIYIWQQLFCSKPELFGLERAWWLSFPYWIAPTLITAIVSYYIIERPILSLRHRYKQ